MNEPLCDGKKSKLLLRVSVQESQSLLVKVNVEHLQVYPDPKWQRISPCMGRVGPQTTLYAKM